MEHERNGTHNCKRKIMHYMKKCRLDILVLAEAHVNTNSREQHDDYVFTYSTSITDDQRATAEKEKDNKNKRRRGAKVDDENKDTSNIEIYNMAAEKNGHGNSAS